MLVGVVSDTHNNLLNVKRLVALFNKEKVDLVIHTGDISQPKTIDALSELDCPLLGVFGNNDVSEEGLIEACKKYNYHFQQPPLVKELEGIKIAVFHEPDYINEFLEENNDINLVLHGHTHRYFNQEIKGIKVFNPGESAGMIIGKNAIGLVDLPSLKINRIFF